MKISMLTGENPFYPIQEEEVYETPAFILERIELEEGTYHPGVPGKKDGGYEHTTISKHASKKEFSHHTNAVKQFRDTIEKHHKGHLEKHGKLPSHEETHKHLENETGTRTAKDGVKHERGKETHVNTPLAKTQRHYNTYHTHIHADKGKETSGETNHIDHKTGANTSHTASHMLHWRKHENGKIHIMGVSSKHNHSHVDNIKTATENHQKYHDKGKGHYHEEYKR